MASRPHIVRRLYNWVLSWAEHPRGSWALFGISFAESSFFPIPPDPLLIALGMSRRDKSWWYAFITSFASVLGGLFGYLIGAVLWGSVSGFFFDYIPGFSPDKFARFESSYLEHGFLIVFLAGFTPIPYKIITIASGALGMPLGLFLMASLVGRSARFFLVAGLVKRYGAPMKTFLEKNFDRCAIAFAVLLVGGIAALKLIH
ncbi:MAG: YqaA family protein [Planctomycetota bacterium]